MSRNPLFSEIVDELWRKERLEDLNIELKCDNNKSFDEEDNKSKEDLKLEIQENAFLLLGRFIRSDQEGSTRINKIIL